MATTLELFDFRAKNMVPQQFWLAETNYNECTVTCKEEQQTLCIIFDGVVGFRKTEFKSLAFADFEGKLVDLGVTDWLNFIRARLQNWSGQLPDPNKLRHLLMNFYEGPSYEFICYGFRVDQ